MATPTTVGDRHDLLAHQIRKRLSRYEQIPVRRGLMPLLHPRVSPPVPFSGGVLIHWLVGASIQTASTRAYRPELRAVKLHAPLEEPGSLYSFIRQTPALRSNGVRRGTPG